MNQIQQIQRINLQELESGSTASWHDQYKDSAYINVGGLPFNLTEGDVIAIFSQYGEILDINLPRDGQTGKPRGFCWIMYHDQRSTVLAVDNLNGATILGRMIRVDHTLNYKQLEHDQETGKMRERETESFSADPRKFIKRPESSRARLEEGGGGGGESSDDGGDSLPSNFDPEDPMAEYILSRHRQDQQERKRHRQRGDEGTGTSTTSREKEDKRRRKEERRLKREERERKKALTGKTSTDRRDEFEVREANEPSRTRRDHRDDREVRRSSRAEGYRERSRERSPRRDAEDRVRSRHEHETERSRDDRHPRYDRRSTDDPDARDRSERRRRYDDEDARRDSREPHGRAAGKSNAFSDLEKWARG